MTKRTSSKPTLRTTPTSTPTFRMERREGILQMRLHTDGGTLHWGEAAHAELGQCYYDIGSDPENRAVIVTGTGEYFNARYARGPQWEINPQTWDHIY